MSLIRPYRPNWTYWVTTYPATPTTSNPGVSFTAGTSNAKGSTTSLFVCAQHCELLTVGFLTTFTSTVAPAMLADIMIDPAGGTSWATDPLVPDLIVGGHAPFSASGGVPAQYSIPIFIPAGAAIGVRAQWGGATAPASVCHAQAFGGNTNPGSWWCGQKVTAYGITSSAASRGTSITSGASSAYSAWTSVGSVTDDEHEAWLVGAHSNLSSTAGLGFAFQIGYNSTKIGPTFAYAANISESCAISHPVWPIYHSVPAGTQMQVRAASSSTATAVCYGLYGIS